MNQLANHCIIIFLVVSYQFVWFIVALLIAGTTFVPSQLIEPHQPRLMPALCG